MISGKDEKILPSISNQNYNDDLALSCTVVVEKGGGEGERGAAQWENQTAARHHASACVYWREAQGA